MIYALWCVCVSVCFGGIVLICSILKQGKDVCICVIKGRGNITLFTPYTESPFFPMHGKGGRGGSIT